MKNKKFAPDEPKNEFQVPSFRLAAFDIQYFQQVVIVASYLRFEDIRFYNLLYIITIYMINRNA